MKPKANSLKKNQNGKSTDRLTKKKIQIINIRNER
jgi:hypothetical protein